MKTSKLDDIIEEGIVVVKHMHTGDTYQLKDSSEQQLKDLFKEIVNSSSRKLSLIMPSEEICPTKVLLEKIEEL